MSERRLVVHRSHPHDVYIGRPSKWGNPFRLKDPNDIKERRLVVLRFAHWFYLPAQVQLRVDARNQLRGKVLGCYCAPPPCHGDVLAKWANR